MRVKTISLTHQETYDIIKSKRITHDEYGVLELDQYLYLFPLSQDTYSTTYFLSIKGKSDEKLYSAHVLISILTSEFFLLNNPEEIVFKESYVKISEHNDKRYYQTGTDKLLY